MPTWFIFDSRDIVEHCNRLLQNPEVIDIKEKIKVSLTLYYHSLTYNDASLCR